MYMNGDTLESGSSLSAEPNFIHQIPTQPHTCQNKITLSYYAIILSSTGHV
ncbi:hypothetical protein Hanom_Chr12g01128171 [Helianthus anomalus]